MRDLDISSGITPTPAKEKHCGLDPNDMNPEHSFLELQASWAGGDGSDDSDFEQQYAEAMSTISLPRRPSAPPVTVSHKRPADLPLAERHKASRLSLTQQEPSRREILHLEEEEEEDAHTAYRNEPRDLERVPELLEDGLPNFPPRSYLVANLWKHCRPSEPDMARRFWLLNWDVVEQIKNAPHLSVAYVPPAVVIRFRDVPMGVVWRVKWIGLARETLELCGKYPNVVEDDWSAVSLPREAKEAASDLRASLVGDLARFADEFMAESSFCGNCAPRPPHVFNIKFPWPAKMLDRVVEEELQTMHGGDVQNPKPITCPTVVRSFCFLPYTYQSQYIG